MTDELKTESAKAAVGESGEQQAVEETVREAVESGPDVRERVKAIVIDLFTRAKESSASAEAVVRQVYDTATDVVKRSAPENPDSVLREVIDGVAAGVQTVAQSTKYAFQEASDRGQRFASADLEYAKKNMKAAADILTDTVRYASERAGAEIGSGARELKTHAERAAEAVRPVVTATLDAITRHPVQTATEAAGTTIRGGRLAAGAFLSAVSGILAGAAEILDPDKGGKKS